MDDKTEKELRTIEDELAKRKAEHTTGRRGRRTIRRIFRGLVGLLAGIFFFLSIVFMVNFFRLNSDLIEGHIKQRLIPTITGGKFPLEIGKITGDLITGVDMMHLVVKNPHFPTGGVMVNIPVIKLRYSLLDILFGQIVLEKLFIQDPVLVLSRNMDGRAIWNFGAGSSVGGSAADSASSTVSSADSQAKAEAMADRYLRHIEIRNLSIMMPKPRDLLPDQTFARILRIPPGNLNLAGINFLVRKYPHADQSDHVLKISSPANPNIATLKWTRWKQTGNYNFLIDAFQQRYVLEVNNVGQAGRKIQLYDERKKDRLNLQFGLSREEKSLFERIVGCSGNLSIPELSDLAEALPWKTDLKGGIALSVLSPNETTSFLDSAASGTFTNLSFWLVDLPDSPKLSDFNLSFEMKNRNGEIRSMELEFAGLHSSHMGIVDCRDLDNITGSLTSEIASESMLLSGSMKKAGDSTKHLAFSARRDAGLLEVEADQEKILGMNYYKSLSLNASIKPQKLVSDLVPSRLLPPAFAKRWNAWISRVDLVGPVEVKGTLPSAQTPGESTAKISLKGSTIISKTSASDRVSLDGEIEIASNTFNLSGISATLDSLQISANGTIKTDPTISKPENYNLSITANLVNGKPLIVTGKKIQNSLGLAKFPPIESVTLEGDRLFSGSFSSDGATQTADLNVKKIRLKSKTKTWWIDNLLANVQTYERLDICRFRPENLDLKLSMNLFGFPVKGTGSFNVASALINSLELDARGSDFNVLFSALREHPAIDEFLKSRNLSLNGAFNLSLKGKGKMNRPALSGNLRFPSLNLQMPDFSAVLPFQLSLSSANDGEYSGDVSTNDAKLRVKGIDFNLDKFKGSLKYAKPKSAKENIFSLDFSSNIFGTTLTAKTQYAPKSERISSALIKAKSSNIQVLAAEIAKIAKLKLPFSIKGNLESEIQLSGTLASLKSKGFTELENLTLKFPIKNPGNSSNTIDLEGLNGRFEFNQSSANRFDGQVLNGKAFLLGAPISLDGKAHLEKASGTITPVLDDLTATIKEISASGIQRFLSNGIVPSMYLNQFSEVVGNLTGRLTLSGAKNRYVGIGELAVVGGGFRHVAQGESVKNLSGRLIFSRRLNKPEPQIDLQGFTATFGRAKISIPSGRIFDPQGKGNISLIGAVDSVFPSEIMALLSSLKLPSISFPREGPFFGKLALSGTLAKPRVETQIEGSETDVLYQSEGNKYTVPIGKSILNLTYDLNTGLVNVPESIVRFLNGELIIKNASGKILNGKPQAFKIAGSFDRVDLGSIQTGKPAAVRGILAGEFSAEQNDQNKREALLQMKLKNFVISRIPLDKAAIDKIGLDFLEEPEITEGKFNLYLSSEGELTERGRLRVADGLFAGPDMRLELGESSFDPKNLQLAGKLFLNPQPLRRTKLGKKLGSLTRLVQDKETGLPFVDLTVSGTWDNPGMMSKTITDRVTKRAKRNFIKSIFGGRRSHKASVEELKEWFPGWQPGQ